MRYATIFGLGLIGGSIGKALRRAGWHLDFVDPAVTAQAALQSGAAERKLEGIGEVGGESVVLLAMPVDVSIQMLATSPQIPNLLSSVCSVMLPLHKLAVSRRLRFVAGHPMAGSEQRGLAASREDLFAGRNWFYEQSAEEPRLIELIGATGARPVPVDPALHDRMVTLTSHLPQLLSTALGSLLNSRATNFEMFAGSGLATFLRLAGSDRSVWHSVFEANPENLERALAELQQIVAEIARGEDEEHFRAARELFNRLSTLG